MLDNANGRILKNGNVLSVKERSVSQIEGSDKLKGLLRAISGDAPK